MALLLSEITKPSLIQINGEIINSGSKQVIGIDIRKYFYDNEGNAKPTKKGIFLQWQELCELVRALGFDPAEINDDIKNFLLPKEEIKKL